MSGPFSLGSSTPVTRGDDYLSSAGTAAFEAVAEQAAADAVAAAAVAQAEAAAAQAAADAAEAGLLYPVSYGTAQNLTATGQRIARSNIGLGLGLELTPNYRTTAGVYVLGSQDHGQMHVARNNGVTVFDVAGIAIGKVMWIGADYNSGPVTGSCIVTAGPGYYFRNATRRDGNLLTGASLQTSFRLWPGDVVAIWKLTTNEYWIVAGYARPSYVPLGTNGANGFLARGHDGNYYGKWLRTLVNGDNTLTFSTIYTGAPAFSGPDTRFGGFTIHSATGVASQVTFVSSGAGTMVLNNADATTRTGMVEFWNLRI